MLVRFFRLSLLAGTAAAVLSGCTALDAKKAATGQALGAAVLAEHAQEPGRRASADPVREHRGAYGGTVFTPTSNGDPLPARLEAPAGFSYVTQVPMTLHELAAAFTQVARVPVRVRDPVVAPAPGAAGTPSGTPGANAEIAALLAHANANLAQGPADAGAGAGAGAALRSGQPTMTFEFARGRFSEALSVLAGRFGVEWEYRGGVVELYRYVTRSFQMAALPTNSILTVSSGGQSGQVGGDQGTGTTSGLEQSAKTQAELKFWEDLKLSLETVAGSESRIAVSPSTGTVTVTTTASAMRSVARFIADTNRRQSRRVAITVQVLSVSLQDSDEYGVDLNLLFRNAGLRLRFSGPSTGITGGVGSATVGILDSAGNSFAGSSIAVQALTSTQRAFVDTAESVTTSNNRLASKRVVLRNDYVRSAGVSSVANVGSQTDIRTVTRETGFIATFLPRIQEDGEILLQYGITLSDPSRFDPFETGGITVQLERGASSETSNEIALPSGATLVVSSFTQNRISSDARGTGSPYNILLGGGISGGPARRQLIVLITPVELARDLRADDTSPQWPLPGMPEGFSQ